MAFRIPPPLRHGDLVAVVAPASPFDREELMRGLAWLRTRHPLRIRTDILTRAGYLAGQDERRARELGDAMLDPDVRAILAARGGYGAMRIVDRLPWDAFAARPKWLVGFSDVTALHVEAASRGIATVHGPNVTGLGRSITAAERASLLAALGSGDDAGDGRDAADGDAERMRAYGRTWSGLTVVHAGEGARRVARGPVVGGNLAIVAAMAAAGRFVVPEGAVLVLEDVTERPYRIDRMLTSLLLGGHLSRASAVVFGGFTQCEPGPDGITTAHVLEERTARLGVPVLSGAPFGHGAPNHAFVLGAEATVDAATLTFARRTRDA